MEWFSKIIGFDVKKAADCYEMHFLWLGDWASTMQFFSQNLLTNVVTQINKFRYCTCFGKHLDSTFPRSYWQNVPVFQKSRNVGYGGVLWTVYLLNCDIALLSSRTCIKQPVSNRLFKSKPALQSENSLLELNLTAERSCLTVPTWPSNLLLSYLRL